MPMFPLGSVLLPYMPLQLRVFEQRYLTMLTEMFKADNAEFGVVLIERGQEVGGGEERFRVGTLARIQAVGSDQGAVGLIAAGRTRFRVDRWLADDPYPRAEITLLPDLLWDPECAELLDATDQVVRRALVQASTFDSDAATGIQWPADVDVDEDPLAAAWQLAGVAPLGPLDQVRLLEVQSVPELLTEVVRLTQETPWWLG